MLHSHIPGGRLPLLSARPTVTFPARERHRRLAGTKLYCLVAEAHGCEQLAQSHYLMLRGPGVEPVTSRSRVQHPNHYTTRPPRLSAWHQILLVGHPECTSHWDRCDVDGSVHKSKTSMVCWCMSTEGHAMVASYSRGTVAYINYTSVPVRRSSAHCLSFWFYMSAGPVGSLAVYLTSDGLVRQRVWQRHVGLGGTGISGRWLQGEIQLSADVFPLTEVCSGYSIHSSAGCGNIVLSHWLSADRCFVAASPRLWNRLPAGLRQTDIGCEQFK